jgi:hypothetical protein
MQMQQNMDIKSFITLSAIKNILHFLNSDLLFHSIEMWFGGNTGSKNGKTRYKQAFCAFRGAGLLTQRGATNIP